MSSKVFNLTFIRRYHFNLVNLKIGFTNKVALHPNSDKLYISQIRLSDPNSTKQVCSGLRGLIPRESFESKYVVVVDNMKKSKLRGEISEAMLLCGQDRGNVQLCRPAASSEDLLGRNVLLETPENSDPPTTRKIKSKEWEDISSRLYVGDQNVVVYRQEEDSVERPLVVDGVPIVVDDLPRGSIVC